MSTDVIVDVRDLRKIYNEKSKEHEVVANDGISFRVYRGECVGILGPNGSGKTTLVRQLIGYLPRTSGEIKLFGMDYDREPKEIRKRIGYMKQDRYAHWDHLKVEEALNYAGSLKLMNNDEIAKNKEELIDILGLDKYRKKVISTLSGGNRQSVSLAMTLINKPELIILDEPSTGLDPVKRTGFWKLLIDINTRNNSSILIVSHNVTEIEKVTQKVVILNYGKVIEQGEVSALKDKLAEEIRVEITVKQERSVEQVAEKLNGLQPIIKEHRLLFYCTKKNIPDVLKSMTERAEWDDIDGFDVINPSLEDIYIKIVNRKME